jgi:hypothetical protein
VSTRAWVGARSAALLLLLGACVTAGALAGGLIRPLARQLLPGCSRGGFVTCVPAGVDGAWRWAGAGAGLLVAALAVLLEGRARVRARRVLVVLLPAAVAVAVADHRRWQRDLPAVCRPTRGSWCAYPAISVRDLALVAGAGLLLALLLLLAERVTDARRAPGREPPADVLHRHARTRAA